jgi:hypothetical protein
MKHTDRLPAKKKRTRRENNTREQGQTKPDAGSKAYTLREKSLFCNCRKLLYFELQVLPAERLHVWRDLGPVSGLPTKTVKAGEQECPICKVHKGVSVFRPKFCVRLHPRRVMEKCRSWNRLEKC